MIRPMRWQAFLVLVVLLGASLGVAGGATVVRDVARVYSAPQGVELDRLRRGEQVDLLAATDRRSSRQGVVWVQIRRPGGRRGWMQGRDLGLDAGTRLPGQAQARRHPALDGAGVPALAGVEIPIVDMDFACRAHAEGRHIGGCDLTTVVQMPDDRRLRGLLIARVACVVAVDWTGVSGRQHRQSARTTRQLPVGGGAQESSLTLSYTFPEAATGALVASQNCFAAGL